MPRTWLVDGRFSVTLQDDDVELAKLLIQDGTTTADFVRQFRHNGKDISEAVSLLHCARKELEIPQD